MIIARVCAFMFLLCIIAVQAFAEDVGSPPEMSAVTAKGTNCDSSSQIIDIKVTGENNKPIYYTYNDRTSIIPEKWTWYPKIFTRDQNEPLFPESLNNYIIWPKSPQDFYHYNEIGMASPKVWISAISLDNGEKHDYQLESNQAEIRICDLKPGLYKIIAGTVIQVDRRDEFDTGVTVPPSGDSGQMTVARLPSPPLVGNDEYGSWECYHLENIDEKLVPTKKSSPTGESILSYEKHYVYIIYKRYTYNIIRETITCLEPDEKEDKAYILLPTKLENLPMINENEASLLISQPLDENAKSSIIGESEETAIEHFLKYSFPKLNEKSAGFAASGVMNIIYIAIDPSYNLDEQLPIKVGGVICHLWDNNIDRKLRRPAWSSPWFCHWNSW